MVEHFIHFILKTRGFYVPSAYSDWVDPSYKSLLFFLIFFIKLKIISVKDDSFKKFILYIYIFYIY